MPGTLRKISRKWWPRLRKPLAIGFFLLVLGLLVSQARSVDWGEVATAVRDLGTAPLFAAAGLVFLSYAVYST